jgi:hypothetical protein
MRRAAHSCIAAGGLAAMISGCTAVPANYAATLSQQDPKWQSPECQHIRAEAANYKQRNVSWASGLLLGPYSMALVAASKEHQEKQRILFAREMHLACSSKPLPRTLEVRPPTAPRGGPRAK